MSRTGRLFTGLAVSLLACCLTAPARADTVPGYPDWQSIDIGTSLHGSINVQANGTWIVAASGADIWNLGDAFRYTYTAMIGDFSVTCRVLSQTKTDPWSKIGVMIRDTIDPGSRHMMLVRTPGNGVDRQWRTELDQQSFDIKANAYSGRLPVWLRVQRTGSIFMSFASPDGVSWKQVGQALQINMGSQVLAGVCLTAHNDSKICTASVDSVTTSPDVVILGPEHLQGFPGNHSALLTWYGLPDAKGYNVYRNGPNGPVKLNQAPVLNWFYVDPGDSPEGLPDDITQQYTVTALFDHGESLPSPIAAVTPMQPIGGRFIGYDVNTGTPGHGAIDPSTSIITVEGSGNDIWDGYDRMYYLATPVRGAAELTARILSKPRRTSEWAKTGLMVRETLDGTARNGFLCATPDHGLVVQWRHDTAGGSSNADAGTIDSYPLFLRIRRAGDLIKCFRSDDGTDFQAAGQTVKLDNLSPTVFIGFAATAHQEGSITHAEFDQVTLR